MLAVALVGTAFASQPSTAKAAIKTNINDCEVTGTFAWKNVTGVQGAWVQVVDQQAGYIIDQTVVETTDSSGRIDVEARGTSGTTYVVVGFLNWDSIAWDTSPYITLQCRE